MNMPNIIGDDGRTQCCGRRYLGALLKSREAVA
jgi:hypothetical protein